MGTEKNILSISVNLENGEYKINVAEGSNVAEVMFAVAAMIRCFVRDNVIDNSDIAVDLLKKYLTDVQYDEVIEASNNDVQEVENDNI